MTKTPLALPEDGIEPRLEEYLDSVFRRPHRLGEFDQSVDWWRLPPLCRLAEEKFAEAEERKIRRIAFFSEITRFGGVERVTSILLRLFGARGYAMSLFTESRPNPYEFAVPPGLERVILPQSRAERWRRIRRELERLDVDTCVFCLSSVEAMYDIICAKMNGVRAIAATHGPFFHPLFENFAGFVGIRQPCYGIADAVTCLSRKNLLWWRASGIGKSAYLPNPLPFDPAVCPKASGRRKRVLFAGRVSEQKGALFLPRVFRMVLDGEPDAEFDVLGRLAEDSAGRSFEASLRKLGVSERVRLAGRVPDVSRYLSEAAVHVMPSSYEGFPMVFMEAKAHGVPTVAFEMAYLEAARPGHGCVMVGKEDVAGMAEAVLRLLRDRDYWEDMSHKAVSSLEEFTDELVVTGWDRLFRSIENHSVEKDFAPGETADNAFLALTLREYLCGMGKITGRGRNSYGYLKPVDKFLRWCLPLGSRRRRLGAGLAAIIRRGGHAFRDATRRLRGER